MGGDRTAYWSSTTDEKSEDVLARTIAPWAKLLLLREEGFYKSKDMKIGFDCADLIRFKYPLMALVRLDPRGAFFKQDDVAHALFQSMDEEIKISVEAIRLEAKKEMEVCIGQAAYAIRVMCSHVRYKVGRYSKKGGGAG